MLSFAATPPGATAEITEAQSITPLNGHVFEKLAKGTASDWVVVFCDDSARPCKYMVESLRKLAIIWVNTNLFPGTRFGEVQCDQDRALCASEGITTFPMAVHYRNGIRVASWTYNEGETTSMVWQFVSWAKNELVTATPEVDVVVDKDSGTALPFSLVTPFAGMDRETA